MWLRDVYRLWSNNLICRLNSNSPIVRCFEMSGINADYSCRLLLSDLLVCRTCVLCYFKNVPLQLTKSFNTNLLLFELEVEAMKITQK